MHCPGEKLLDVIISIVFGGVCMHFGVLLCLCNKLNGLVCVAMLDQNSTHLPLTGVTATGTETAMNGQGTGTATGIETVTGTEM